MDTQAVNQDIQIQKQLGSTSNSQHNIGFTMIALVGAKLCKIRSQETPAICPAPRWSLDLQHPQYRLCQWPSVCEFFTWAPELPSESHCTEGSLLDLPESIRPWQQGCTLRSLPPVIYLSSWSWLAELCRPKMSKHFYTLDPVCENESWLQGRFHRACVFQCIVLICEHDPISLGREAVWQRTAAHTDDEAFSDARVQRRLELRWNCNACWEAV